ncbi:protein kinase activator Bem1 [Arthroderma uncinatum]|uniref:protein kinase activator Bem1 n=1 Tax=Arthroderma uncinatum TaxID=74035 RepID=UPI00144AB7ED|nr:protein kinase activator Bem1 [Arthroderma uncinatum]KAF3480793.1 protein kinase activator Bem1 [Arthroderma uncinatum]
MKRPHGFKSRQAIRRSFKGEKDHKSHVSITPKSALAILPPKKVGSPSSLSRPAVWPSRFLLLALNPLALPLTGGRRRRAVDSLQRPAPSLLTLSFFCLLPYLEQVIKALYDYRPASDKREELAFSKGDFFHVISREDDLNWYEACNPLFPNARGLVPVAFFEVIGKNQRDSGDSLHAPPEQSRQAAHDSGFADSSQATPEATNTTKQAAQFRMSALGKGSGAMVYGIVMYDFNAERPDELEAKAGEAIIVIAQSNPEWFVAKPIGRLGGPGLIPVSFIEIRDMSTGKSAADPLEAVRRAGVPRVEEWKKMTAEYKNSSISLGKFENGAQQAAADLERMSLNNSRPSGNDYNHQRNPSKTQQAYPQQQQQQQQQQPQAYQQQGHYQVPIPIHASIPRYCFDNDKYWYVVEVQMEDGRWWELARYYHDFYDFQIALLSKFEDEAGNRGGQRTLPFMPGPVTQVTNAISNGRRQSLDEYVKQLLAMPPHISRCQLVRQLFAPRPGDFEIDPAVMSDDYRLSSGSQQSSGHNPSRTASRQSSQGQMNGANPAGHHQSQRPTHQRSQGSVSQTPGYPGQQQQNQAPSMSRQGSSFNNQMPSSQSAGAIKIKVFFQDDIIVIRVPDDIGLRQLVDKLRDRLKVDEGMVVRYKDEPSNSFVELLNDIDLETAIRRNAKLMLYVSIA